MGAQRVKSHELTVEDIDRMRAEEEAQASPEESQEIGSKVLQLAEVQYEQ